MESQKDRVKLNVGGRIFETTTTTLASAGKNSFFGAMFDENWNLHSDAAINEHFIDRNPDYFAVLLDLLRTKELYIPPKIDKKLLYREALYYGLLDHVRSAKCGPFDGNRLRLVRSVTGWPSRDGEVNRSIRASPSGWCSVAHGSVVHVYDWMLDEHPTINVDYHKVNDVCWIDSENIVVSSEKKLASGGIGLFSASTGELRCKFQVSDENILNDYSATELSFSSDYKLFSSCKRNSNERGIVIWDQVTGKQINFFSLEYAKQPYCLREYSGRLQWLYGTNCLMVVTKTYPHISIRLLDFRENAVVWSWPNSKDMNEKNIGDAIVIEENNSICVVAMNMCLGFIDLRSTDKSLSWRERCTSSMTMASGCYFPKLAFHEGQLLSSMDDTISVYCGSNWALTSQHQQSHGSPICDFSIGGDRLFALHQEEDVIDIWETPRPSII